MTAKFILVALLLSAVAFAEEAKPKEAVRAKKAQQQELTIDDIAWPQQGARCRAFGDVAIGRCRPSAECDSATHHAVKSKCGPAEDCCIPVRQLQYLTTTYRAKEANVIGAISAALALHAKHQPQQPSTPATPAKPSTPTNAPPKLQAAACRDNEGKPGICQDRATCKGKLTSGKCAGAANIMCCSQVPAAPTTPTRPPTTPTTPTRPPTTPTTPAAPAAGACVYASAPTEVVAGNGNVKYTATLLRKEHMSEPAKYGLGLTQADNRIVINTGTACAFEKMHNAAKAAGVTLTINSAFRSLSRQQYFWNCYVNKNCNGGNLAAKPGTSNHGQGLALDLNTNCGGQGTARAPLPHPPAACKSNPVYKWLYDNAPKFGFVRAVQNEPWHWEYRPGRKHPAWAW